MAADTLTRVGDVLDALLALTRDVRDRVAADDPGARFDVHDGATLGFIYESALIVGIGDGPDIPGYRAQIARAEGMGRRKTETVTVHCLLTLTTGDDDKLAALRSRATSLLRALDGSLRADDVVQRPWQRAAVLGDAEWTGLLHEDGSTLNILFDVEAECLL